MNLDALTRIARTVARAETGSRAPRYRQIIDALVRAIEEGALSSGERLPPETMMADLFSVSLGTIQKALAHRPGRLSAANAPPRHLCGGPSSRRCLRVSLS